MDDQQIQQPAINLEPEQSPLDEIPQSEVPEQEPEISLQDGELKFSDDFFGDVQDNPKEDNQPSQSQAQTPNYYTGEELQEIPYEKWDTARMPEDVKPYVEAYLKQRATLERQRKFEQDAQTPTPFLQAPKEYTPKEMHDEAVKLACEKLGIANPSDFDTFEGEHQTALEMARQELIEKNSLERANYRKAQADWAEHQKFNAQLAAQPDFAEFEGWYLKELQKYGYTPQQINEVFNRLAMQQGLQAVRNAHLQLFQEFRASKAKNNTQTSRPRPKTPPVLESTRGGNYDGRKTYNMRDFSQLDDDAQAKALMDMGIV